MRRWRTALCSSALLAIGATRSAAAVDTLPAVSDPGTSSRVETIGSFGYKQCWYGVYLNNCAPSPFPPVSPVSGHTQSAETADTQPLSLTDSFDPTPSDVGGQLIQASASSQTAYGVNRASVSASGSFFIFPSHRVSLPVCNCEETVFDNYEGYEAAAAVSLWQDTWTFHGPPSAGFTATVVLRIDGTTDLQTPNLGYIFDGYYSNGGRSQASGNAALLVTGAHWFASGYNANLPGDYYHAYQYATGWVDHDTTTYPGPSFSRELRTDLHVTLDLPIHVASLLVADAGGALDSDDALDVSHTVTLERIEVPDGVTMTAVSGDASLFHVPEPAAAPLGIAAAGALLALRPRRARA